MWLGGLVGLRTLAVVARLAGAARIVLTRRTAVVLLARGILVTLSGTAITGLYGVVRSPHLLLAAAMRHARQAIAREGEERRKHGQETQPSHGRNRIRDPYPKQPDRLPQVSFSLPSSV